MNALISHGVAGFRIDAAKHIWPADLEAVLDLTDDLDPRWFGPKKRSYVYHEVIDGGNNGDVSAHDYTGIGRVTDFTFSSKVNNTIYMLKLYRDRTTTVAAYQKMHTISSF